MSDPSQDPEITAIKAALNSGSPTGVSEAVKLCDVALAKSKSPSAELHYLHALALHKAGTFPDALTSINTALGTSPGQREYAVLKATILESMKNLKEAVKVAAGLCEKERSAEAEALYVRLNKALLSTPVSGQKEEEEFYKRYEEWMKGMGSQLNKIAIKYIEKDYRGMVATTNVAKGEILVSVPKEGMITLKMAKQTSIGKKLIEAGTSLIYPNNSMLSTYVLIEQANPHTKWTYLLEAMPRSVSNFPIFFTPAEKKLLTGSQFLPLIQELRDDMKKDYDRICKVAPEFGKIATVDDFMKTRALVNSRIFGTKIDGEENDSIVPFADMFNYKYKSDMTHWNYSVDAKAFIVRSKCTIKAGDEIFVYYGNKPNSNFFQFYGFIIENNDNDEVQLDLALDPEQPMTKLKADLLDHHVGIRRMKLTERFDDEKFRHVLSYLRFTVYQGPEDTLTKLKAVQTKPGEGKDVSSAFKAQDVPVLSSENEKKALTRLKELCEQNLAKFPETIEKDEELLKTGGLSYNEKNCVLYRYSEKRIYNLHIQLAKAGIEAMERGSKSAMAKMIDQNPRMKPYFTSIQGLITKDQMIT